MYLQVHRDTLECVLLAWTIFGSPITEILRSAGSDLEDGKDGFRVDFIDHGNEVNLPRWLEVLAEEERMMLILLMVNILQRRQLAKKLKVKKEDAGSRLGLGRIF
jgi:hypothetical protein